MIDQLLILTASFNVTAGLSTVGGVSLRRSARFETLVVVAASGLLAAAADGSPTGAEPADLLMRFAVGALAAAAGAYASLRVALLALVLATAAGITGGAEAWIGPLGLGVGLTAFALGQSGAVLGAVLGTAAVQAALRADTDLPYLAGVVLAGLTVGVLAVGALPRMQAATRRRALSATGIMVFAAATVTALYALNAASVRDDLDRGVDEISVALTSLQRGELDVAAERMREAAAIFEAADRQLSRWWLTPARYVPVVGLHVEAVETLTGLGAEVSARAAEAGTSVDLDTLRLTGGRVDLEAVAAVAGPLRATADAVTRGLDQARAARSPLLAAPLGGVVDDVVERLEGVAPSADLAARFAEQAPALLGGDEPRTYFVAFLNPAEARGAGGIVGNFAELTADSGALSMTRFGRASSDLNQGGEPAARTLVGPDDYRARYAQFHPEQFWQDVTLSPHFPSVAQVIEGLYPQSGGREVDGVVAVDPYAIAALLQLTGPVDIPGLGEALTAENAAEILLVDQYVRFPQPERVDFLESAARAVMERITTGDLPDPGSMVDALRGPLDQGRLVLHSTRRSEQALFEDARIAGELPAPTGDVVHVVTQNANPSKIDTFLHRAVSYRAAVDPGSGDTRSALTVELENRAPADGLPAYVIGGDHGQMGLNRSLVSISSPLDLLGATVDGGPLLVRSEEERGLRVYSAYVSIPPGATVSLVFDLAGTLPVSRSGDDAVYRLTIGRQPTVHPDAVDVGVTFVRGWRTEDGTAGAETTVAELWRTTTVEVPVTR